MFGLRSFFFIYYCNLVVDLFRHLFLKQEWLLICSDNCFTMQEFWQLFYNARRYLFDNHLLAADNIDAWLQVLAELENVYLSLDESATEVIDVNQ